MRGRNVGGVRSRTNFRLRRVLSGTNLRLGGVGGGRCCSRGLVYRREFRRRRDRRWIRKMRTWLRVLRSRSVVHIQGSKGSFKGRNPPNKTRESSKKEKKKYLQKRVEEKKTKTRISFQSNRKENGRRAQNMGNILKRKEEKRRGRGEGGK